MAKKRLRIPEENSTEILFLCDRTCCKCNVRGKGVQIHHIDEDTTNFELENLAPLCLECHNETLIKGGFTRQLNASQVRKYRADWIERVQKRRDKADELASIHTVTGATQTTIVLESKPEILDYFTNDNHELLISYLKKILIIHSAQLVIAGTKWDSGVTSEMNEGNSDMVDFYEEVIIELASFYPKWHFDGQVPRTYFSEFISKKFNWHSLIIEPDGIGTGGRIASTILGGNMMSDLKQMIIDMVDSLSRKYPIDGEIDVTEWNIEFMKG